MKKSYINITVTQIANYYKKGALLFNHPIQRKGGQWNLLNKSLLIHSIIAEYPVPPIYSIVDKTEQENGKTATIYQIIDGKQRLLNILGFINGEYALHEETPEIEEEENGRIAGKLFDELATELQEKLTGFSFTMYKFDEYTDDELEEMFFRLNNGVVLSKDQKTKAKLGTAIAKKIDVFLESDFIENCTFTASQLRKADDMAALLQGMMLLDNYEYDSFSSDAIMEFAIAQKDYYRAALESDEAAEIDGAEELFDKTSGVLDYLAKFTLEIAKVEDEKRLKLIKKYLKKINIPMLMKVAEYAAENSIEPIDFLVWYESFFGKYKSGGFYGKFCAAGSVKKESVTGRLTTMMDDFNNFMDEKNPEWRGVGQATDGDETTTATEGNVTVSSTEAKCVDTEQGETELQSAEQGQAEDIIPIF